MIKINKSYIFIALSIAIILCVAILFVGLYSTDKVYADSLAEDYTILNFNQLVDTTSSDSRINFFANHFDINGYINTGTWVYFQYHDLYANHEYYVYCDIPDDDIGFRIYYNEANWLGTQYPCKVTFNSNASYGFAFRSAVQRTYHNYSIYLYMIDLTNMFGSNDNIPTLEECETIFSSKYYPYTEGTPVTYDYLASYDDGYQNGFIDGQIDEENNNKIVYFNQMIENDNQSYDSTNSNFIVHNIQLATFYTGHKYYLYVDIINGLFDFGYSNGPDDFHTFVHYSDLLNSNSVIFNGVNTDWNGTQAYFAWANHSSGSLEYNSLNVIDLTAMYGSDDNIPTLEQLDQIFASKPYSYNEGIVSYSSSIDQYQIGYINGFNSAFDSQNVSVNSYVIGSNAYAFSYDNVTSSYIFNDETNQFAFYGYIGVPVGNLVSGTTIDVDFTLYVNDFSGLSYNDIRNYRLYFYYNSYNMLVRFGTVEVFNIDGLSITYSGSISLPVNLDTIFISLRSSSDYATASVVSSSFTFRVSNIQAAIDNAFKQGVQSVYNIYQEGGVQYNRIYNNGFKAGQVSDNPYTFSALMSSVIEAPLSAVMGMFNFEFLGVNLKNVVTVLFTLAVLVAILGLFMGGKS